MPKVLDSPQIRMSQRAAISSPPPMQGTLDQRDGGVAACGRIAVNASSTTAPVGLALGGALALVLELGDVGAGRERLVAGAAHDDAAELVALRNLAHDLGHPAPGFEISWR